MKNKNHNTNIVYTNSKADKLLAVEIPIATKDIVVHSQDLAVKELPKLKDPLKMYLPMIVAPFQAILENIHQLIGAKRAVADKEVIEEQYAKEEQLLTDKCNDLSEDLRVAKKKEREYNSNLGHEIRNWHIALFFLVLLSFTEILLNYKIFLLISSTSIGALISSLGLAISFFIIAHIFPTILRYFEKRWVKWCVGLGIITFVSGLLYNFSKLRLSYTQTMNDGATDNVSEFNFLIINLTLFLSGVALTLIYKPTKKTFSDYYKHKRIGNQIKHLNREYKEAEKRLMTLEQEKGEKLSKLDGVLLMAHHYEQVISAAYLKAFALWCNENLITRKDKVQPQAFLETPTPLTTYFDNVEFQTNTSHQSSNR